MIDDVVVMMIILYYTTMTYYYDIRTTIKITNNINFNKIKIIK